MDSRALAALLSSLVSELLLLLLLFPSSSSPSPLNSDSLDSRETLFNLIQYFISSTDLAASLSLITFSRKRRRTHPPDSDSGDTDGEKETQLEDVGLAGVGSTVARGPDSFKLCFRMSSSTFEWLSGLLEPLLDCRDPADSPLNLPAEIRLGIGLSRLATGPDYSELACRFGVSESVARFCAKQLCRVLCTNFRFWVAFPTPAELKSVSSELERLAGLPNCCGVIGCARFKIVKPKEDCESSPEEEVCEESIAAQIVVDSSSRILSIVAGYRGEKSDLQVLKSSTLYKDVQGGNLLCDSSVLLNGVDINQYLVGSEEYPLFPWLMVPFVDPGPGSCEENFNSAHHLMRLSAFRTTESLKNWGVLSRPINEEFKTAVAYIGACSILHNVLLMREDYSALVSANADESSHDHGFQYYTSLEENSIENKASVIRSALATRATEFKNSKQNRNTIDLEHQRPN